MSAIETSSGRQLTERPGMKSGDTVRVHVKVREGDKERVQVFEGIVIGMHRGGARASFTVRKVSFGQGVERIFPLHSPTIQKVDVVRSAQGAPREAVLPARPEGQGRAHEGNRRDGLTGHGRQARVVPRASPAGRGRSPARCARSRTRSGARVRARRRRGRSGPRLPGRARRRGGRRPRSRPPHRRPLRLEARAGAGAGAPLRRHHAATRWPGRWPSAEPDEIDTINIHQASLRAMRRAVMALAPLPDWCSSTRSASPTCRCRSAASSHGDRRCAAIAAASIVAKVTRDRLMRDCTPRDPRYGFDRHKGYATAEHLAAVARTATPLSPALLPRTQCCNQHRRGPDGPGADRGLRRGHRPHQTLVKRKSSCGRGGSTPSLSNTNVCLRISRGMMTTANALGDCYYRAHRADKAVEQYVRIADYLLQDGLLQPAGALYRKILKHPARPRARVAEGRRRLPRRRAR